MELRKLNKLAKRDPLLFATQLLGLKPAELSDALTVTPQQVHYYLNMKSQPKGHQPKLRKLIRVTLKKYNEYDYHPHLQRHMRALTKTVKQILEETNDD